MNKIAYLKVWGLMFIISGVSFANNNSLPTPWSGVYLGLETGAAFNEVDVKSQQLGFSDISASCTTKADFSSPFPGLQFGYMHQFAHNFFSAIEANVRFNTDEKKALGCTCPYNANVSDQFLFSNRTQVLIKGRAGRSFSVNKALLFPYVTAGLSLANAGLNYRNEGGDYYSTTTHHAGGLTGLGLEWAFNPHWSLRVEYSYTDYEKMVKLAIPSVYGLIDPLGSAQAQLKANAISLTINYWIQ